LEATPLEGEKNLSRVRNLQIHTTREGGRVSEKYSVSLTVEGGITIRGQFETQKKRGGICAYEKAEMRKTVRRKTR